MCKCDQSIELTKDAVRRVLISYTEYSECVLMCVCSCGSLSLLVCKTKLFFRVTEGLFIAFNIL